MNLVDHQRMMARNNAWSNARLHAACAHLSDEEFAAERTGFFPSLQRTLNHILVIDRFYLEALEGGGRGWAARREAVPCPRAAELWPAQREQDRRLVAYCDALGGTDLECLATIVRDGGVVHRETVGDVLAHLFVHQIHHRGQAHAMLSGTAVAPPQLDEFFLAADHPARDAVLARLGLPDAPDGTPPSPCPAAPRAV